MGSHFHFIETNPQLDFDRIKAYGYHLDIPSGTSARFEPGDTKTVTLTQISGLKTIVGGSSVATGTIDTSHTNAVLRRLKEEGFLHTPEDPPCHYGEIKAYTMDRMAYAMMYGPTVGDTVRLGSTNLRIQVEKDYTAHGDECTFGGGKTLRDGIGQAAGRADDECADLIIVNALVLDWSGIFKADIGVKDGVIVGIGKAGNPDVMDGVNPSLIVGSNTDVIAAEGKILTAGGIDTHVHYICPQQIEESLAAGITTMFGGGTGASTATVAANCTPSKTYIRQMMQALDRLPVNFGVIGKGSDTGKPGLHDQCQAGVAGLKLHEDWGCTPSAIDTCLRYLPSPPYEIQTELGLLTSAKQRLRRIRHPMPNPQRLTERIGLRGTHGIRLQKPHRTRLPHRRSRRRARTRHDLTRATRQRAPQQHEPHEAVHLQHGRRAPGHGHVMPPPVEEYPRGHCVRG